jgi:hypothetical protein
LQRIFLPVEEISNEQQNRTAGTDSSHCLLPIVLGYWQARALAVATELDVPDLLAQGPLHVEALASRTNTDVSAVFRLLRALESIGIFVQVSPRIFSNTAASECLRKDVPGSQWPTVVHCLSKSSGPFEGWNELEYAVRTCEPSVDKVYGHDFWELLRRNPQANAAMNGAMRSASVAMTPVVTAAYKRAAAFWPARHPPPADSRDPAVHTQN